MSRCLLCLEEAAAGRLCAAHAAALRPCREVTATQIVTRPVDEPQAWLVDQFGCTHPVSLGGLIGRTHEHCALAIMHHSVSARHARLGLRGDAYYLVDERSLNGTYVDGVRIDEARLRHGDRLTFGEVPFYFVTRATPQRMPSPGIGGTVPTRAGDISLSVRLHRGARTVELVQRIGGGLLRLDQRSLDLGALEFSLLQALAERAQQAPDAALAFLPTGELVRKLRFRSDAADDENLRELIRRVRRKLRGIGIDDLIESRRGAGYRLGWEVEARPPG